MYHNEIADEAFVEKARRTLAFTRRKRWAVLWLALWFLGACGYSTVLGIRKRETTDAAQLNLGFGYCLALALCWTTFGLLGALCLGKFIAGFGDESRTQELMIRYHDRLLELRDLPGTKSAEPGAGAAEPHR